MIRSGTADWSARGFKRRGCQRYRGGMLFVSGVDRERRGSGNPHSIVGPCCTTTVTLTQMAFRGITLTHKTSLTLSASLELLHLIGHTDFTRNLAGKEVGQPQFPFFQHPWFPHHPYSPPSPVTTTSTTINLPLPSLQTPRSLRERGFAYLPSRLSPTIILPTHHPVVEFSSLSNSSLPPHHQPSSLSNTSLPERGFSRLPARLSPYHPSSSSPSSPARQPLPS